MEITRTVPTVLTGRPLTATSLCLSASQLPAQWDPPRTQAAGLGLGACAEDPGWGVVPPLQPSRHGTPILPGQASRTRALDVCSRGPAHSLSHCHPQGFFSYCCPSSGCPCLGLKIGPGYHVWGSQDTLQREQSGLPWGLDSCVSDPRSPLPYNRIQHPQGSLRIRSGPLGYVLSTPAQPHPPEASLGRRTLWHQALDSSDPCRPLGALQAVQARALSGTEAIITCKDIGETWPVLGGCKQWAQLHPVPQDLIYTSVSAVRHITSADLSLWGPPQAYQSSSC